MPFMNCMIVSLQMRAMRCLCPVRCKGFCLLSVEPLFNTRPWSHPVEPEPKRQPDGMNVVGLAPLHRGPMRWCERFGERIAMKIATWFQQACSSASSSRSQWISSYQLYCDYMLCSGEGGPIKVDQWIDPCQRPHADLLDISFKLRCRWLTHLVKELWKEWQYKIQVACARPHSETLILHASCAWLRWPVISHGSC